MKEELFKEKSRYITGFVLIIVADLILYADNLLLFWAVLGGIYAVGFSEALRLFQVKASFSLYLILVLSWVAAYFNGRPIECALISAMVMASVIAYQKRTIAKPFYPFCIRALGFLRFLGFIRILVQ